jgi:hypothetical protein
MVAGKAAAIHPVANHVISPMLFLGLSNPENLSGFTEEQLFSRSGAGPHPIIVK